MDDSFRRMCNSCSVCTSGFDAVSYCKKSRKQLMQWSCGVKIIQKYLPVLLIETLVVCFLCSRKPLWKVETFLRNNKIYPSCFRNTDLSAQQLNDDAYGAALDKLSDIKMETLISAVSLTLLAAHQLSISSIRLDTTSVSYQGECAGEPHGDFDVVHRV